jgi:hypothetical protein
MKLTEKQLRALEAVGDPLSAVGTSFWHDARISWPGPRKTLGSLMTRGLVDYHSLAGWMITDEGRAVLADRND